MNHSKKIILISIIFFLCLTSLSATGAGFQLGGNPGLLFKDGQVKCEKLSATATGTIKLSRLPLTAGLGFEAGKSFSDFSYGLYAFADYWLIDLQLKNTWNFYSGLGACGSLLTSDFKNFGMTAGARIFAGTNWLFWDNYLELYLQQNIVPSYAVNLNKPDSDGSFMLCFPLEAGLRFHF